MNKGMPKEAQVLDGVREIVEGALSRAVTKDEVRSKFVENVFVEEEKLKKQNELFKEGNGIEIAEMKFKIIRVQDQKSKMKLVLREI